jgi:hypothetical protein
VGVAYGSMSVAKAFQDGRCHLSSITERQWDSRTRETGVRCRLHVRFWAADAESFPNAIGRTAGKGFSVLGANSRMVPSVGAVAGADIGPSKMMLDQFVWLYGWSSVTIVGTNSSETTEVFLGEQVSE